MNFEKLIVNKIRECIDIESYDIEAIAEDVLDDTNIHLMIDEAINEILYSKVKEKIEENIEYYIEMEVDEAIDDYLDNC